MQTVTAGRVSWVSRGTGIERASRRQRPRRVSKMKSRGFEQACKRDTMTYDNRTEEIQPSRRTTYRAQECEAVRLVDNWNTERGESGATAAVCMREMGDKAREMIQGRIYPTSDPRMWEHADPPVLEPERGINKIYETKIA